MAGPSNLRRVAARNRRETYAYCLPLIMSRRRSPHPTHSSAPTPGGSASSSVDWKRAIIIIADRNRRASQRGAVGSPGLFAGVGLVVTQAGLARPCGIWRRPSATLGRGRRASGPTRRCRAGEINPAQSHIRTRERPDVAHVRGDGTARTWPGSRIGAVPRAGEASGGWPHGAVPCRSRTGTRTTTRLSAFPECTTARRTCCTAACSKHKHRPRAGRAHDG